MAKRKSEIELAEIAEAKTRRLRAKLEQEQIKAALAYHAAADRGRRNRDWLPKPVSADQALIPEHETITGRSRQAIANSWVARAAMRAHVRNIVGRGIEVVPTARTETGADLAELNAAVARRWSRWASRRESVDVEKRRTFWQVQRVVVSEEFAAGQAFVIWSIDPDKFELRLQLVESEQLDHSIQYFEGNEVRGGIELDEDGSAVAYHFYRRNPNDYLVRTKYDSVRVLADRVMHYYDAERVQQTHGLPRLSPVLQELRDLDRFRNATLMRAVMEACIGLIIQRQSPTMGGLTPTLPRPAGDSATTANGQRTADFRPGMLFEAGAGESVSTLAPSTPGTSYAPFTELSLRGIGAGIGQSYGALTRHNDGNYSAARQDMLEDEREIGPAQDNLVDQIICPVYELWYRIEVAAGRIPLDISEFAADPDRYTEAEYVPPLRPWIDPEKEINAYTKGIEQRIVTRSEIIAQRGGRLENTMRQIAAEREVASSVGVVLPEDVEVTATLAEAQADAAKAKLDTAAAEAPPQQAQLSVRPPGYRRATLPQLACASCSHYDGDGGCMQYNAVVDVDAVCDSYAATDLSGDRSSKVKRLPPGPQEGERPIDNPGSDFLDRGVRGVMSARLALPTPQPGETRESFTKRFMADDTAAADFPDEQQRYAVAQGIWSDDSASLAKADVDLTPTKGMQDAARDGLRRHEAGETGDGLKPETVSRANRIASGERLTPEHVREMAGWFARHGENRQKPGTPWYAAWQLWGGDAGESWSTRKSEELENA